MNKTVCDFCHKEIKFKDGEKVVKLNYGLVVPKNHKICEDCLKAVVNMQKGVYNKND